jgi:hypothetical protein
MPIIPVLGRSFIHFELDFVQSERQGSSFNLLHVNTYFSQHHLLEVIFSPMSVFGTLLRIRWL